MVVVLECSWNLSAQKMNLFVLPEVTWKLYKLVIFCVANKITLKKLTYKNCSYARRKELTDFTAGKFLTSCKQKDQK